MMRPAMARALLPRGAALRQGFRRGFARTLAVEVVRRRHNSEKTLLLLQADDRLLGWRPLLARFYADYPTHIKVPLPALSPTMEEGTIVSWAKKEGDKLNEGDLLAEIETDKATMAFETPEEGYLAKILIPAGTAGIPVGKLVCIIVEKKEDIAAFKDFKDDGAGAPAPGAAPAAPGPAPAPASKDKEKPPPGPSASPVPQEGERVKASPMAKRLAEQRQIRLQGKGSGLFGSITSKDLDGMPAGGAPAAQAPAPAPGAKGAKAAKGAPPAATGAASPYTDVPVTGMRAVIAKRLLQSKQTIPHFYVQDVINVDKLLAARAKFNKALEKQKVRVSVNDFVIKACAYACGKVPEANSFWMDSFIRENKNCDVSVAVSTDKGLLTPIIFEANAKGLVQISKEMKALAAKARDGKLQPQEFQGGTFTVSNLGMFHTANFSPIINPPQSCILGVGTSTKTLVPDDSPRGFTVSSMMWVTLSADHRVVDGAVAARWMQHFKEACTDPENMLL